MLTYTGPHPLRHVRFTGSSNGWRVGDLGGFHTSTDGGANWSTGSAPLGQHRHVLFADTNTGWLVTRGAGLSLIYGTDNSSDWNIQHLEMDGFGGREIRGLHRRVSGGTPHLIAYGDRGGLWRFEEAIAEPAGFLGLPAQVNVGSAPVGGATQVTFEVPNLGSAPITLFEPALESDGGSPLPFLVNGDTFIPPGEVGRFEITFRPTAPGDFRATLRLAGDSINAEAEIELIGRGVIVPATIIVDTHPSGGLIRVNGVTTPLPAVYRVVEGPAEPGEWSLGETRSLVAGAINHRDGLHYRFSRWRDAGGAVNQSVTADGTTQYWIAEYQPTPPPPPPFVEPPVASPEPCEVHPPEAGVLQGPWIRISNATLQLVPLGNDGRLLAEGALLLAPNRAEGHLKTSALTLTQGGAEIVHLTAGSLSFGLEDGLFTFEAFQPGLRVFTRPALPPASIRLAANPSAFRFEGDFALPEGLPLLPGLIEFGPAEAGFRFGESIIPSISAEGSIRILKRPNGTWALTRAFAFDSADAANSIGLPSAFTLIDLGVVRIRGDQQSGLIVQRSGSVFTLGAQDLLFDGFGISAFRFSPTVNSTGQIAVTLGGGGIAIGPAVFTPQPGQPNPAFAWNALSGNVLITVPASNVSTGLIPGETFTTPAFDFDSTADFEFKFDFPDTFAGLSLTSGPAKKNYLIFERKDGIPGLRLRNEVSGFWGRTTLRMEARGAPAFSLSGTVGWRVDFPAGNRIGSTSLGFDTGDAPYEFSARRRLGGIPVELGFGTAGIPRICPLACLPGQALGDCPGGCP
ncbi:MAG: hypothetical protein EA425_05470 [Puniceicoccaceae bacterium]|nr:MAG: hypothetical protein EA425_05470 [Puniceicoccaceae bacterium]